MITDNDENNFIWSWAAIEKEIHNIAEEKGWWDEERSVGEIIALCHSELSEALEAFREGNKQSMKIPHYSSVEEELADTVIRIMDFANFKNLRLAQAILAKIEFNKSRPRKHGKLF